MPIMYQLRAGILHPLQSTLLLMAAIVAGVVGGRS